MVWLAIGLAATSIVLAVMLFLQAADLHEARKRIILLTLAWRKPESVAGRDILPEAHQRLRYQLLGEMVAEGMIECIIWGDKIIKGRRYVQRRYRILPPGRDEIRREWR